MSIIMRVLRSQDGDFSTYLDKIKENSFNNTSLMDILSDKLAILANEGKAFGHLAFEQVFWFCITFRKVERNLCFHITLKSVDLQD